MDGLRRLAEQQHGVVSRAQCRDLGMRYEAARSRRGAWERVSPRVLRLIGAPKTERSALMAAVLDAGRHAAASHRSAAALWQLPGFRMDAFDVVRRHDDDHHRVSLGRLHT